MASSDLSLILPRVLIVSRRTVRKNKLVDFVGEYHLDLIVSYGAVPVIVPRVAGVHMLLDSFEPIHGVLLCEGEDIDPALYEADLSGLTAEELEDVRRIHASDVAVDREKDSIELRLAKLCVERNIPCLGICRGSQVLNVACGGTLYQDIGMEVSRGRGDLVNHIDYDNYDGHRHVVRVLEGTPLQSWFTESLEDERMEISVNSYHHQGVKRLAERFIPMAFALDGLIEGFYDPEGYNPQEGKFIMGLQFHPERMRNPLSNEFEYPGCKKAYQEFVNAVVSYQRKVNSSVNLKDTYPRSYIMRGLTHPHSRHCSKFLYRKKKMEKQRKDIVQSFSIAKNMYYARIDTPSSKVPVLEAGAEFLESITALSLRHDKKLKQMGATVRNASGYPQMVKMDKEREMLVQNVLEKISIAQLTDLRSFYNAMGQLCSEEMERKLKETAK